MENEMMLAQNVHRTIFVFRATEIPCATTYKCMTSHATATATEQWWWKQIKRRVKEHQPSTIKRSSGKSNKENQKWRRRKCSDAKSTACCDAMRCVFASFYVMSALSCFYDGDKNREIETGRRERERERSIMLTLISFASFVTPVKW